MSADRAYSWGNVTGRHYAQSQGRAPTTDEIAADWKRLSAKGFVVEGDSFEVFVKAADERAADELAVAKCTADDGNETSARIIVLRLRRREEGGAS